MLSILETKHNIGVEILRYRHSNTVIQTAPSHLFWYKMELISKNALIRAIINENQELVPIVTLYRGIYLTLYRGLPVECPR